MTFKEFIENHTVVFPFGEPIKLTPFQHNFIDWIEECKKKGLKPSEYKGRI